MNLAEVYTETTKSLENDGIEASDVAKASASLIFSPITSLYNKVSDGVANTVAGTVDFISGKDGDDNVYIPAGTKTLIGQDFESLYESTKIKSYANSDGTESDYIVSTSSYYTEMRSGNASANEAWSYDEASGDKVKAIYEITLLSKKYSYLYEEGNDTKNALLETEYADYMSQYRGYCESNGISWDDVMTGVSAELQTECAHYMDDSDNIFKGSKAEENRVIVNRAHSMLTGCMSEGYTDQLIPALEGKITYEDTLDTNPKDVNFLINIKNKFTEFWDNVKDKMPHPFRAIKETVSGYALHLASLGGSESEVPSGIASDELVNSVVEPETQNAPENDNSTKYGEKAESEFQDVLKESETNTLDEEFVQ